MCLKRVLDINMQAKLIRDKVFFHEKRNAPIDKLSKLSNILETGTQKFRELDLKRYNSIIRDGIDDHYNYGKP